MVDTCIIKLTCHGWRIFAIHGWGIPIYEISHTHFHRQLNEHLEQKRFYGCRPGDFKYRTGDASITSRNILPYRLRKFVTITNGYDQSDFPMIDQDNPRNSSFTIVHLGSLYQKTRSSEYFLAALHEALKSGELPPGKIRVRFIGNLDKETQRPGEAVRA